MTTTPRCAWCGKPLKKFTNHIEVPVDKTPEEVTNQQVVTPRWKWEPQREFWLARAPLRGFTPFYFVNVWDGKEWGYNGKSNFHSRDCAASWADRVIGKIKNKVTLD